MNSNVMLNYGSTLEGAVLITLTCENDTSTDVVQALNVTCHSSGSWIPDPAQFTCSSSNFEMALPGTSNSLIISIII